MSKSHATPAKLSGSGKLRLFLETIEIKYKIVFIRSQDTHSFIQFFFYSGVQNEYFFVLFVSSICHRPDLQIRQTLNESSTKKKRNKFTL